jgi:hypothetical protein
MVLQGMDALCPHVFHLLISQLADNFFSRLIRKPSFEEKKA